MQGIGIDLVDIARIRNARFFERLSEYILRANEIPTMNISRDRHQYLASRLAVKEAVVKAFPFPLTLQDIEVLGIHVRPTVRVHHEKASGYEVAVSLSHTEELAIGTALVAQS